MSHDWGKEGLDLLASALSCPPSPTVNAGYGEGLVEVAGQLVVLPGGQIRRIEAWCMSAGQRGRDRPGHRGGYPFCWRRYRRLRLKGQRPTTAGDRGRLCVLAS